MHNGFLNIDNEKMSKSLGNFFTTREVLAKIKHPEVLRFFLLSSQYRGPMNYSPDQLEQAEAALNGLYTALRDLARAIDGDRPRRRPPSSSPRWTMTSIRPRRWPYCRGWRANINSARDRGEVAKAEAGASELRQLGERPGSLRARPALVPWRRRWRGHVARRRSSKSWTQRKRGQVGKARFADRGSDPRRTGGRRHHPRGQAERCYLAPQVAAINLQSPARTRAELRLSSRGMTQA